MARVAVVDRDLDRDCGGERGEHGHRRQAEDEGLARLLAEAPEDHGLAAAVVVVGVVVAGAAGVGAAAGVVVVAGAAPAADDAAGAAGFGAAVARRTSWITYREPSAWLASVTGLPRASLIVGRPLVKVPPSTPTRIVLGPSATRRKSGSAVGKP